MNAIKIKLAGGRTILHPAWIADYLSLLERHVGKKKFNLGLVSANFAYNVVNIFHILWHLLLSPDYWVYKFQKNASLEQSRFISDVFAGLKIIRRGALIGRSKTRQLYWMPRLSITESLKA